MDGAFAALRESGRLAPLIERATANRAAHEPELRRTLRAERLDLAAPDFELPRQGGGTVKLSELRGKVVILDFWATWCGPCRKSLPALQTYYEKKRQNVEVFCVNVFERDGGRSVEPFWKQSGYPMPVLLGTQEVAQQYAVSSIPTLLVIGPEGRINYRHQGFDPNLPEQLHWMADALLDL
jgi:thiol-disulfide isomerase/thioredoxin